MMVFVDTKIVSTRGGWVEDWRHTPQVRPIRCSPFPLGVPHEPNRKLVSSPRHFKPIVPISSNGLTCSLLIKGYVTDSATWLFGSVHGRRSR
jgi:hypothetical protein